MAVKFVFLLALVALAYGVPVLETADNTERQVGVVEGVPESVAQYLDQLFAGEPSELVLTDEPLEAPLRQKRSPRRVCRRVIVRRNGRNYPRWQCV